MKIKQISKFFYILNLGKKKFVTIFFLTLISIFLTLNLISNNEITNFSIKTILFLIINIILFLILIPMVLTSLYKNFFIRKIKHSFLQNRIILAFCLVSAIPTIIVAIFSTYIFNFALQPWFDKKVTTILEESTTVAQAYIEDQATQLKESALSAANDFSDMYYELVHNPRLLVQILNGHAQMRAFDEAIIFESNTNTILAQTAFSFSLSFTTIPKYLLEMSDQGIAVQIPSEPTKIRILVKLPEFKNTYLLIGRVINKKIIEHIDKNKGAAKEYYSLKDGITSLQIKFSIIFIIISLLLLGIAIIWGVIIARQIVKPIKNLVLATEKAKKGDLTVQVNEKNLAEDEVLILTKGFNRMIRQIHLQHRDLVIAQRALAWSDVARRVAHEIKNPLTPIQLASERLIKRFSDEVEDKESFKRYIKTILSHSQDIEKIVTEFVNFARLPLPKFGKFDINRLINELIETRKLINDKINYFFTSNVTNISFIGDSEQINRAILNLIKNSEEVLETANHQGEININIVQINNEINVYIQDNGPGFQEYLLAKATQPYVTSNRNKGMGLGLAIVKKIVEDHLGTMEISNISIPKNGACIKLAFNVNELSNKLK